MVQIIKNPEPQTWSKTIMQLEEGDNKEIIIKSTSITGDNQVQLILTKHEVKRLSEYFISKCLEE